MGTVLRAKITVTMIALAHLTINRIFQLLFTFISQSLYILAIILPCSVPKKERASSNTMKPKSLTYGTHFSCTGLFARLFHFRVDAYKPSNVVLFTFGQRRSKMNTKPKQQFG
jgi:hypothetical protein